MMRLATVVLVALVLLVPADALGGELSFSASVHVKASHGYRLNLQASDSQSASVELSKGRASAVYEPRGKVHVTPRRIRFSLGPLGRVNLRFHETSRSGDSGEPCQFAFSDRSGDFRGLLRFRGEDRYSEFEAHRVHGSVFTLRHVGCHGQRPAAVTGERRAPKDPDPTFLIACTPAEHVSLFATREHGLSVFGAFANDRTRSARIERTTLAFGGADGFTTSGHLRAAELNPPGPLFSGSAAYSKGSTSGDLTALLPGLGDVPMVPGDALLSRNYRDDPPRCIRGNRSVVALSKVGSRR